jgi:hypothetical protein
MRTDQKRERERESGGKKNRAECREVERERARVKYTPESKTRSQQ